MEKGFGAGGGLAFWGETCWWLLLQVPIKKLLHTISHEGRSIFSCKNVQTLPTGQIGQARSHREVLPTPPPEVPHQQDLDTDPSQIRESQQVSQTEEMEAKTLPTRWRTVKAHRTSLKTFPPGSQWTKVAEPNKGMRTANSNLSKVQPSDHHF